MMIGEMEMKYRAKRGKGCQRKQECPSALMRRARAGVRSSRTAVSDIN